MPLARARRRERALDYWPGFVDALSTLLLVMIFLLCVFMLAQFFLARDVTGKDTALQKLDRQVAELSSMLALERAGKAEVEANEARLVATLETAEAAKARLQEERNSLLGRVAAAEKTAAETAERAAATFLGMQKDLSAEKQISGAALAKVETLADQVAALRAQLSAVEETLSTTERRERESQAKIADLGSRLNVALAQQVQELGRYRSEFFGRMQEVLGDRPGIKVAGDRFIVQAEVLFASGRATLDPAGRGELDKIAAALVELDGVIPKDIAWVLRVDGHTDRRPIRSAQFSSNWALSAARATAVVQYLISRGVPAQHLAAAGFGEFHPTDAGEGEESDRRNRRIELKITEK